MGLRSVPRHSLFVDLGSVTAVVVVSVIYLWPIHGWPQPPKVVRVPGPAAYASYDVVAESASDAYLLIRPPGGLLAVSLYRTQDGGTTWHRIALPTPVSGGYGLSMLRGGYLFLRTFTVDTEVAQFYVGDGNTWVQIPPPDQDSGSLQMVDSRVGFYVVTTTSRAPVSPALLIYRTQDSGHTWDLRLALRADHPSGGGIQLSDANRFISFSDGTHGWMGVIPPSWGIVCGTPRSADPQQRLMASQDGGETWAAVRLGDSPPGSTEIGTPVFPVQGPAGYLPITANTYVGQCPPTAITYLYCTLDGGVTWSGPRRPPAPVFDSPDGVNFWAFDGHQLFRSADQGSSWRTIKPKLPSGATAMQELVVASIHTAWAVWSGPEGQPTRQMVLRTTDDGAHWSVIKLPGA